MTYDWDLIKPEIRESYVIRKQRLVQVARAIRERYGFDIQSVTPSILMMRPLFLIIFQDSYISGKAQRMEIQKSRSEEPWSGACFRWHA